MTAFIILILPQCIVIAVRIGGDLLRASETKPIVIRHNKGGERSRTYPRRTQDQLSHKVGGLQRLKCCSITRWSVFQKPIVQIVRQLRTDIAIFLNYYINSSIALKRFIEVGGYFLYFLFEKIIYCFIFLIIFKSHRNVIYFYNYDFSEKRQS